jgi:hypothetical protein
MPPPALTVGTALPDPPFELMQDGKPTGFDVELPAHRRAAWTDLAPHAL